MKKNYLNGVLIYVIGIAIVLSFSFLDTKSYFLLLMVSQLFLNPMMILVYDYAINPSILDRKSYYLLIIFIGLLNFVFKFDGAIAIDESNHLVLLSILLLLQLLMAYYLRKKQISSSIALPLLVLLPLLSHGPTVFLMFAFSHMAP